MRRYGYSCGYVLWLSRQLPDAFDDVGADAAALLGSNLDVLEHGMVQQLPGIVWARGVELASTGQQAEHQVEPGFESVSIGTQVIEPFLCQNELCGDVALFLLEVIQRYHFGQVGIEQALFGAGQSGYLATCSDKIVLLGGLQRRDFCIECSPRTRKIVRTQRLLLPDAE